MKWVDDGTRLFGEQTIRERNNDYLKAILDRQNITYYSISGNYHERLEQAIELVDEVLEEKLYGEINE